MTATTDAPPVAREEVFSPIIIEPAATADAVVTDVSAATPSITEAVPIEDALVRDAPPPGNNLLPIFASVAMSLLLVVVAVAIHRRSRRS